MRERDERRQPTRRNPSFEAGVFAPGPRSSNGDAPAGTEALAMVLQVPIGATGARRPRSPRWQGSRTLLARAHRL